MINKGANFITNPRGGVYHLGLFPEDICPVIITAGDPDRVSVIANLLDYKEKEIQNREFHSVTGTLGTTRILILSTGIGADNIDIVMTEIHTLFQQAISQGLLNVTNLKIIRLGTSGSIHQDHPLDSILVSTRAVGLDNVPGFYKTEINYYPNHKCELSYYLVNAPGTLWKSFTELPSAATGTTLTSPGFYGPQFRTVQLKPMWSLEYIKNYFTQEKIEISNIEMETAALYFFANEMGHDAVSINALIGDRLTNRFSETPDLIIKRMVEESMTVIEGW